MLLTAPNKLLPELKSLLVGNEDYVFLIEIAIRCIIMFIIVVTGLRMLGKRGVKQLSVFELVIILTLGSAAGDPMFYKDVGLLSCALVFLIMLLLYKTITFFMAKSKRLELMLEGRPICLIQDGQFCIGDFQKEDLATDEFYSELRIQSVSQLGQVRQAYLETSGEVSIFYYEDKDVKYGLPILPKEYEGRSKSIPYAGKFACTFCGQVEALAPVSVHHCSVCSRDSWVAATDRKRIS